MRPLEEQPTPTPCAASKLVSVHLDDHAYRIPEEECGASGLQHLRSFLEASSSSPQQQDLDAISDNYLATDRARRLVGFWLVLLQLHHGTPQHEVLLKFDAVLPSNPTRCHNVLSMTAGVLRVGVQQYMDSSWPVQYGDVLTIDFMKDDKNVDRLVEVINESEEKITRAYIKDKLQHQVAAEVAEKRRAENQEVLAKDAVWNILACQSEWKWQPPFSRPSPNEVTQALDSLASTEAAAGTATVSLYEHQLQLRRQAEHYEKRLSEMEERLAAMDAQHSEGGVVEKRRAEGEGEVEGEEDTKSAKKRKINRERK